MWVDLKTRLHKLSTGKHNKNRFIVYGVGIVGKCLKPGDVEGAYERWLHNILNIRQEITQ